MKKKPTLSIVLPALNEENGVVETIKAIPKREILDLGWKVETLVVDNRSTDNTAKNAQKHGARVVFKSKRGYGHSIKKGLLQGRGDVLLVCDADSSYPISQADKLLKYFQKHRLDFLTTNRLTKKYTNHRSIPFWNRIGNTVLSCIFAWLFNLPLSDSQSGMWMFTRSLYERMKLRSNNMAFSQEIKIEALYYNQANWKEVDIRYSKRTGTSKLNVVRDGVGNLFFLLLKRIRR